MNVEQSYPPVIHGEDMILYCVILKGFLLGKVIHQDLHLNQVKINNVCFFSSPKAKVHPLCFEMFSKQASVKLPVFVNWLFGPNPPPFAHFLLSEDKKNACLCVFFLSSFTNVLNRKP